MNIILIGYRASGKTSAGRELARLLGRPFFDSDRMIFAKTGRTVREIVEAGGWQAFRDVEKTVIGELANLDDAVIALGGGAVMDPDNVAMLEEKSRFVWLKADARLLAVRMSADRNGASQRPALTGAGTIAEIEEVLAGRMPVYLDVSDFVVDTAGKEPSLIAREIAQRLADDRGSGKARRKRRRSHVGQ
jgi:shikimate kinase